MVQILHKCATTTYAKRKYIQESKLSVRKLAKELGTTKDTVQKWRTRDTVEDRPSGPTNPKSTVLTEQEENMIVAARENLLLPAYDLYHTLKPLIPKLTISNLERSLKRHGLSRLPKSEKKKRELQKFKEYKMGYVHIDICEVSSKEGKGYLFVAVDRVSKYTHVELYHRMTQDNALLFLQNTIKKFPYKIHTILTDNGSQFCGNPRFMKKVISKFTKLCNDNNIKKKFTKPYHPWTNGQVERINRTIKEATIKKYYYESFDQLKNHLNDFIEYYNYSKRLRALKGKTPYEFIEEKLKEDYPLYAKNPYDENMKSYILFIATNK